MWQAITWPNDYSVYGSIYAFIHVMTSPWFNNDEIIAKADFQQQPVIIKHEPAIINDFDPVLWISSYESVKKKQKIC